MADRPQGQDPDEPGYGWLYGGERKGGGSSGQPGAPRDPDPTQMLPTMNRPSSRGGSPSSPLAPSAGSRRSGPGGPSGPRGSGVQPAPAPRPPRTSRRGRGLWFWVKLVLLLWVVYLVAVPLWAWTQIHKAPDDPGGARPADQPGTTYLLVGSDSRAGLTRHQELSLGTGKGSGRRTDTIMLMHTGAGPNMLMSIPRDSIVDIPGHGRTKVNAAFAYGGPKLLIKTLESETGIRIDDYVEIGFAGFVDVVDAVGGIQICPKTAMKDPKANLDVKAGCQQADGKTALGYARSRDVSRLGDIDRARHQREVVSAVGSKAVSPMSVLNPVRYFRLADAGTKSLIVGKHTGMLATLKFAWAMTHVNGKNGLTCGVPISDLAVNWDRTRALELFKYIKEDKTQDIPKNLCTPSGLPHQ
ncbi:MAG: LCP family protein [Nocardioidaceae bacterium]